MGFFSWLFGWEKEQEIGVKSPEESGESHENITKLPLEETKGRSRYKKTPRTKETNSYVKAIIKKAESTDPKPTPHKDTTDPKQIEDFVNKIQGKKS